MENVRLITSEQPLVFRDGRPFGDIGMRGREAQKWPFPSTVAGAFRTAVGRVRSPDYFSADNADKAANLERILQLRTGTMLPVCEGEDGVWRFLAPRPADAFVVDAAGGNSEACVDVQRFSLKLLEMGCGTDLPFSDWLYPLPASKEKPSRRAPLYWNWDVFEQWLGLKPRESFLNISPHDLGTNGPEIEERMHVGIEAETGAAKENALFASSGICLRTRLHERLGMAVAFEGETEGLERVSAVYLGGERRTAQVSPLPILFPECPTLKENSQYLRLVLLTPGDFGGWCPKWLSAESGLHKPWMDFPTELRLVSAFVPPWLAISGWDFVARGPKATRKLVPAGAVYVVELQDPAKAQEVAQTLWLRSICEPDTQSAWDGFGTVAVGRCELSL
jgi:CRISPR-associated protein Cmr3